MSPFYLLTSPADGVPVRLWVSLVRTGRHLFSQATRHSQVAHLRFRFSKVLRISFLASSACSLVLKQLKLIAIKK